MINTVSRKTNVSGISKKKVHIVETSSISDVVDFAENNKNIEIVRECKSKLKSGSEWTFGQYSPEKCVENIINGNARDFEIPSEIIAKQKSFKKTFKRRKKYTENEGELSVDRVLNGSLKPYRRKTRVDTKQRGVTIYLNVGVSGGNGSSKIEEFVSSAVKEMYSHICEGKMVTIYYVVCAKNAYRSGDVFLYRNKICLLYTSPSPRDRTRSRMPSSA